jgi:hypothetical protein
MIFSRLVIDLSPRAAARRRQCDVVNGVYTRSVVGGEKPTRRGGVRGFIEPFLSALCTLALATRDGHVETTSTPATFTAAGRYVGFPNDLLMLLGTGASRSMLFRYEKRPAPRNGPRIPQ